MRGTGGAAGATGPFFNIFHVNTPTDSAATALSVLNQFQTFYQAIKGLYGAGTAWSVGNKIVRVDLDPPIYVPAAPQTTAGSGAGGYTASQLAAVVSWKTAIATRHGRGRTYIGPLGATAVDTTGSLSSASQLALQNAATALIANLKAVDPIIYPVVWERPRRNPATGALTFAGNAIPVVSAVCTTTLYTQRRRAA